MRKPILVLAAALALAACSHEPDLPMQVLALSADRIVSPSFGAEYIVEVASNTSWDAEVSDFSWIALSTSEAVGSTDITLTLAPNGGTERRSGTVTVTAKHDHTLSRVLDIVQEAGATEGYVSVRELRALEGATLDGNVSVKGFVVTSSIDNNYLQGAIAIQDAFTEAGCGITVAAPSRLDFNQGVEVEVPLQGASLVRTDDGILTLHVPEAVGVVQTEMTPMNIPALTVDIDQLQGGQYESMYLRVRNVQVEEASIGCAFSDAPLMEDILGRQFRLCVDEDASFGGDAVPEGSGSVYGVAGAGAAIPAFRPAKETDIQLGTTRLGFLPGIRQLPYVFSLYAQTQINKDTKYVTVTDGAWNSTTHFGEGFSAVDKDERTGVRLDVRAYGASSGHIRLTHWADQGGHDNIPAKSFVNAESMAVENRTYEGETYYLLTVPLLMDLPDRFHVSFAMNGTGGCIREWTVLWSTDKTTWNEVGTYIIQNANGGWFYYTFDIAPAARIEAGSTFYLKLTPKGATLVNGNTGTGLTSDARLSCGIALTPFLAETTARPADAVYFEAFDALDGGLDYRLGDRIAGMSNYCGAGIEAWGSSLGLTGSGAYARPGYVQVGYVETQLVARANMVFTAGQLETPALGVSGDLRLTFKAMGYLTHALRPNASSTDPADKKGDQTEAVVEIIGGGTVGGQTRVTVSGLSTTEFGTYTLDITGATPATRIRFVNSVESQTTAVAAASRTFNRWFLSEICVTPLLP